MRVIDLTGQRFGQLQVLQRAENTPTGQTTWHCRCDCGALATVRSAELLTGHTVSCGCFRQSVLATSGLKHGQCGSGAWHSWRDMVKRCTNPKADAYPHYGGRGIRVCERWLDFAAFFEDMGPRPAGMTLERKNVDGDYEPNNCIWLSKPEQHNNCRNTIRVRLGGEEMALSVACRRLGISYGRTRDRMKALGWTFEKAISEPKKVNGTIYAKEHL